ncbi:MAG: phospholipase D-like domain-containing protein [Deltaproteobacteria bacterium]|nr:phospholipase D-like domain-containing protein [Deltaproteobacteria bacterium]
MNLAFDSKSIERLYGDTFVEGNRVELLSKGKESFAAIFKGIEEAKLFICLHFYIFRNDETGRKMADALKAKAREGVKVYILYDHFGSIGTPRAFWDDLLKAGIHIRASRPFKWSEPLRYIRRDHRKLIITDGIRAFTGGLNIANEYRGFHLRIKRSGWRDTGVILEGPVACSLFQIFQKTWHAWGGKAIPAIDLPTFPATHCHSGFCLPVIPIFASSSKGRRRMRKLLYYSINNSKESILLTTAYFTPSRRMIDSLEDAVKRGVEVKLLLPGKSDVPAAYHTGRAFFTRLLRAGVKIYTYQGQVLHAKSYVFDGCWSIVGSANLDFQSLRWNDEGNVGILDQGFGRRMTEMFEEDLTHSIEIKEDVWSQRPIFERFKEQFFVLFRRRL